MSVASSAGDRQLCPRRISPHSPHLPPIYMLVTLARIVPRLSNLVAPSPYFSSPKMTNPSRRRRDLSRPCFQDSPLSPRLITNNWSPRTQCVSFTTDKALGKLTVTLSDPTERLASSVTDRHCRSPQDHMCFRTMMTCANKLPRPPTLEFTYTTPLPSHLPRSKLLVSLVSCHLKIDVSLFFMYH